MRLTIRLGIVALFAVVITGAAAAGLYVGSRDTPAQRRPGPLPPPVRVTTDQQIERLLARIAQDPSQARWYTDLGGAYLQKAREVGDPSFYTRAETALTQSLSIDPSNADTYIWLGTLAFARHQFTEALSYGERARELNPYKPAALGVIGDAQVELGRYEDAQATFQAMLDLRPDLASFARASYLRELHGDFPGAIELMSRAVIGATGNEGNAWTRVQLGHLYFNSGDLAQAEKEYRRALFEYPNYIHARAGLARVMAARGDFTGAIALYKEVTQVTPWPEYVIALIDVQAAAGDQVGAGETQALLDVIDRLYQDAGVNTDLEMALYRADYNIDPLRTLERVREALAVRPGVFAYDALAWALYKAGRYEEAMAASDTALRLGSRNSLFRYHAGMIALALGRTERARSELRIAVTQNPRFSVRYADAAAETLRQLDEDASKNAAGR